MSENVKHKRQPKRRGKKNHRWNGGKSHFKNHYQLKLNRLEKLKQTEGKCEICREAASVVYHSDGDRDNHKISNLVAVCNKCLGTLHKVNGTYESKYKRKYGINLKEIAERAEMSIYKARCWLLGSKDKRELLLKKAGLQQKSTQQL